MMNLSPVESFYRLIKTKSTAPRWIIFILDLVICFTAFLYANLLSTDMNLNLLQNIEWVVPAAIVTSLNVLFFRLLRTYEGIIRLSSIEEAIRCVSAVSLSVFVLLTYSIAAPLAGLPVLLSYPILIIYFFTASFVIFAYRLWVKELYYRSAKSALVSEDVFIFGKTESGVLLRKSIESIHDKQYKVTGFIENNTELSGMTIDNIKIYTWEKACEVMKKSGISLLFLASEDLPLSRKNEIADFCIENHIAIKIIPAMQKWIDGQLQPRQIENLRIEDLLDRPSIRLASGNVQNFFSGKRILVTGAAGSIGSEITKQLAGINTGCLILCDNRETGLYELQYELQQIPGIRSEHLKVCICDIRNQDIMENIFRTYKPEIVFHAAAYKHVPMMESHPCQAIINNVMGTKILADLSVKYGVDRFVFISTDKAVNPSNVMGASKRIAEMYVTGLQNTKKSEALKNGIESFTYGGKIFATKKSGTKFITTRFGNVLGSNGSVIPRFQQQIDRGGPVTVTHPSIIRYFMTIPEACYLVLEAGAMGHGGEIFVFDMGEPVNIATLAKKMIKLSGFTPEKDISIHYTGLRPGEKLYEELLHKDEEVIPTHHSKIMISRVSNRGTANIFQKVDYLIRLAIESQDTLVVKQMKNIVVEYKSRNSAYEKLDNLQQEATTSQPGYEKQYELETIYLNTTPIQKTATWQPQFFPNHHLFLR